MGNENDELQRQIVDLRDHQKLLYETLKSCGNDSIAEMRAGEKEIVKEETTYKAGVKEFLEENVRLRVQVKGLTRELAGREEEVRILIEEMGSRRSASNDRYNYPITVQRYRFTENFGTIGGPSRHPVKPVRWLRSGGGGGSGFWASDWSCYS
ncbi:hypothetical protein ABW20_dc0107288 [Dactylellina cionopaga]|nr:hypothetical protein ABW20_dc0107288 [Dactylellina cionopaga]